MKNIASRSRTAKGISDTTTSSKKVGLLLTGDSLARQVKENTENLIKDVWKKAQDFSDERLVALPPEKIRNFLEGWFDISNTNLVDLSVYSGQREDLEQQAHQLSLRYGRNYRINPRYRTWDVPYATLRISPVDLEFMMDEFYATLCRKIHLAVVGKNKSFELAQLLAFADVMLDGEIHPWLDGCGRIATAVIMWLSATVCYFNWPSRLIVPDFDTKDVHYTTIHDLGDHTKYLFQCLTTI